MYLSIYLFKLPKPTPYRTLTTETNLKHYSYLPKLTLNYRHLAALAEQPFSCAFVNRKLCRWWVMTSPSSRTHTQLPSCSWRLTWCLPLARPSPAPSTQTPLSGPAPWPRAAGGSNRWTGAGESQQSPVHLVDSSKPTLSTVNVHAEQVEAGYTSDLRGLNPKPCRPLYL